MTRVRINVTLPPDVAEAARRKSKETGVPLSAAIQRLLARWIETGELPPPAQVQGARRANKPRKVINL